MKRYAVFQEVAWSSAGGWNDFDSAHEDFQDAKAAAEALPNDRYSGAHVVDLLELKIVYETHEPDDEDIGRGREG